MLLSNFVLVQWIAPAAEVFLICLGLGVLYSFLKTASGIPAKDLGLH